MASLRPLMYRTLFGLIAAAGLRVSEALKLLVADRKCSRRDCSFSMPRQCGMGLIWSGFDRNIKPEQRMPRPVVQFPSMCRF